MTAEARRITFDSSGNRFQLARKALGYHEGASAFGMTRMPARSDWRLNMSSPEVS